VTEQIALSGDWSIPNPQNYNSKISDKSLESVTKFKQLGKTITKKKLHS
jgi:hypothetical protein